MNCRNQSLGCSEGLPVNGGGIVLRCRPCLYLGKIAGVAGTPLLCFPGRSLVVGFDSVSRVVPMVLKPGLVDE